MMLWNYFACVLTDPGRVPADYRPDIDTEAHPNSLGKTFILFLFGSFLTHGHYRR